MNTFLLLVMMYGVDGAAFTIETKSLQDCITLANTLVQERATTFDRYTCIDRETNSIPWKANVKIDFFTSKKSLKQDKGE